MVRCVTCGESTDTPERDDWCYFGDIKKPTEDADLISKEESEVMEGAFVVEYSEYDEIEYWECDECCPICSEE